MSKNEVYSMPYSTEQNEMHPLIDPLHDCPHCVEAEKAFGTLEGATCRLCGETFDHTLIDQLNELFHNKIRVALSHMNAPTRKQRKKHRNKPDRSDEQGPPPWDDIPIEAYDERVQTPVFQLSRDRGQEQKRIWGPLVGMEQKASLLELPRNIVQYLLPDLYEEWKNESSASDIPSRQCGELEYQMREKIRDIICDLLLRSYQWSQREKEIFKTALAVTSAGKATEEQSKRFAFHTLSLQISDTTKRYFLDTIWSDKQPDQNADLSMFTRSLKFILAGESLYDLKRICSTLILLIHPQALFTFMRTLSDKKAVEDAVRYRDEIFTDNSD